MAPSAIQYTPAALIAGTAGLPTQPSPASATPVIPQIVAPSEPLDVPPGFQVSVFAESLGPVWGLAMAPNGDLYATVPLFNRIVVLPDGDGDGVADEILVFAEGAGLNRPAGLAFRAGWLYVANTDGLVRLPHEPGSRHSEAVPELVLPLPAGGVHWARDVVVGAEGDLYVSVGASCDACVESEPQRATVMRVVEGEGVQAVATGLRAVGGLAVDPRTGSLWVTENSRREPLAGAAVADELNRLVHGGNFGWPGCHGQGLIDPSLGATAASCAATIGPALLLPPGTGPMGAVFANGQELPPGWQDDLFVAAYGGDVGGVPSGHKVIRLSFEDGSPTGEVTDVVTGWLRSDTRRWGRPAGLAFGVDGALLVADEGGQRVYRLPYQAPPTPTATPPF